MGRWLRYAFTSAAASFTLGLLALAATLYPDLTGCYRPYVIGGALLLCVLFAVFSVREGRRQDAAYSAVVMRLARIEAKRDMTRAAVGQRAMEVLNELHGLASRGADQEWRDVQEAYFAIRGRLGESLDDLAVYKVADADLWQMRPGLPLADASRLGAITKRFKALVDRFEGPGL